MITVYGLAYKHQDYIVRSIRSIRDSCPKLPFRFVICHNKSEQSPEIEKAIVAELTTDDVLVNFQENIKSYALTEAYKLYPPDADETFSVFTDLDLLVDFKHWLFDTLDRQSKYAVTGYSLSLDNYVPPNGKHDPVHGMGGWLMGINSKFFESRILDKIPFVDSLILNETRRAGLDWHRSPKELYHMGWDLWKDDPEYFQTVKVPGTDWITKPSNLAVESVTVLDIHDRCWFCTRGGCDCFSTEWDTPVHDKCAQEQAKLCNPEALMMIREWEQAEEISWDQCSESMREDG
jgi:hypothetical protein